MKHFFTFLFALATAPLWGQYPAQGLLHHYTFDQSLLDEVTSNPGQFWTIYSQTTATPSYNTGANGLSGGAVVLDSTFMRADLDTGIALAPEITVTFFVRETAVYSQYASLVSLGGAAAGAVQTEVSMYVNGTVGNRPLWTAMTAKNDTNQACARNTYASGVPNHVDDTWHFVSWQFRSQYGFRHVRARLDSSFVIENYLNDPVFDEGGALCTTVLMVGAGVDASASGNPKGFFLFNGEIDELRIYDRWLENDQLDSLMRFKDNLSNTTDRLSASRLSAWPNPVGHQLNLSLPGNGPSQVRVLTATGQEVLRQPLQGSTPSLNTEALRPGLYIVEAVQNGRRYTAQLVKN